MFSNDTIDIFKGYVKNCFSVDIDKLINELDDYLQFIQTTKGSTTADIIEDFFNLPEHKRKGNLKGFTDVELFMGDLAEVLHIKDNEPYSLRYNDINPEWNMEHMIKCGFHIFADDDSLKYLSLFLMEGRNSLQDREWEKIADSALVTSGEIYDKKTYKHHFLVAYYARNLLNHNDSARNINTIDQGNITTFITSMIFVMLYLVDKYHEQLEEIYKEAQNTQIQNGFDISRYTRNITKNYSQNQNFKYMDFRWDYLSSNKGSTIGEIINNDKENTVVIFTGEAGTGKTTALRRLEYSYANKCNNTTFDYMPVFIELKNLDSGESIFHAVCDAIDIDKSAVTDILEKNKLVLLLDGLNEISAIKRRNIRNEIAELMEKNKNLQVYITDRNKQDDQFFAKQTITRYQLHELSMAEKIQYFKNNSIKQESIDIINKAIELKDKDYRIIDNLDTPYKLHVFLKCVEQSGVIPEHPISDYIDQLLKREEYEHKDASDPEYFEHLRVILAGLAVVFDEGDFSSAKAYKVVKSVANDLYGFVGIDSVKLIDLSVNMGILTKSEKNVLQFENSHFVYYFQDYAQDNGYDDDLKELKDDFS